MNLLLLVILAFAPLAHKSSVTLSWDLNKESNIAGYNLYYGRGSRAYERKVTVVAPPVTVKVQGSKTLYFAVTAFNTSGQEGLYSNEVHYP